MLRRATANPPDFDRRQAADAIRQCNRLGLWEVLSRGVHIRVTMVLGTARVSPLVLAKQANYREDPDVEHELPDTVQALLWVCCSPDDFGAPEVSPLSEALRTGDDMAVSLLPQHRANPSRRAMTQFPGDTDEFSRERTSPTAVQRQSQIERSGAFCGGVWRQA